ncbi:ABC transporter ATP-binding protein [Bosea sp. 124]|uniref:ABC transporter ATP-binding protein n=1 Tax=Bosea sp. 124 TaxID=2135642 RepID=UPI0024A61978|nr:ABC transporter ATP-binding protein [Bosea sp. 124]
MTPLLSVEGLRVDFHTSRGVVRAVDGVSWTVYPGETMAIVGESGCGKSVSALAVMGLLARPAGRISDGRIMFGGRDLTQLPSSQMRELRGRDIAMIFQEPMTSLNPVLSIGLQLAEPLRIHLGMSKEAARARAIELLGLVGIADAERRLDQYPHQFSGGMRQRVMIAIALTCNPKLIIADEPTTALDVTIQAQVLELMKELSQRLGIALVIITHNLGIVARYADRLTVMYAGRVVEEGTAAQLFALPRHPYTLGLLRSVPRLDRPRSGSLDTIEGLPPNLLDPPPGCRFAARCLLRDDICETDPPLYELPEGRRSACHRHAKLEQKLAALPTRPLLEEIRIPAGEAPLLSVRSLRKDFHVPIGHGRNGLVRAVDDVSFDIPRGTTLGVVGESGCGKTTVGRMILRLTPPTSGEAIFEGADIAAASEDQMRKLRLRMQVVFQDPFSSLNPRMSIGDTLNEPQLVYRKVRNRREADEHSAELLRRVGLVPEMASRYPHQLSGGQRQRVGIARALAMQPSFIVCDEPVSALDVSVQAQIMNLLTDLQHSLGMTFLFIAHDLAVVRHISQRIVVMYLGRVVEMADCDDLYREPLHPYTEALLDAAPVPDPTVEKLRAGRVLKGEPPSPLSPPSGCTYHTRCPRATSECAAIVPPLREIRPGHFAACIKL